MQIIPVIAITGMNPNKSFINLLRQLLLVVICKITRHFCREMQYMYHVNSRKVYLYVELPTISVFMYMQYCGVIFILGGPIFLYYYIPINVISLDPVDFTEQHWITTLWFSESISPLSETEDVIHITLQKICTKYFLCLQILLLSINTFFMHLE